MAQASPQSLVFAPGKTMPNSRLPVLLYRGALAADAADFDTLFRANGWVGIWHDSVYEFDHYHSNAHEALGVSKGQASLQLGGPEGQTVEVAAGDCIVLPAGTGHRRISASADFEIVGCYPPGQEHYDICRKRLEEADRRIASAALPKSDPVLGSGGGLLTLWSAGAPS